MTDDVSEIQEKDSDDEIIPEMSIEERREALKKSRWNVFMYLGIAAILFAFALYPFVNTSLTVDESIGSTDYPVQVWGLPIPGEDFTDIPVEVSIDVQSLPTSVSSIEIFMIENSEGCDDSDGSNALKQDELRGGKEDHPNKYHSISDPVESTTYDIEFGIDPGIYCLIISVDGGNDYSGIDVSAELDIYPVQMPLAIIASMCLLMSGFAFIGAQKHGKFVKNLVETKDSDSIEDTVLSQTAAKRIQAGPSGPPTGPSGLPAPGPVGPPAPGPSGPPETLNEVVEAQEENQTPEENIPPVQPEDGDVYEDQGDGWFFRKFADGTYDQTVYTMQDGQYVPYENPDSE